MSGLETNNPDDYSTGQLRDQMKRNIALRLLVEKWRECAAIEFCDEVPDSRTPESMLRQCAKELEEAISGL